MIGCRTLTLLGRIRCRSVSLVLAVAMAGCSGGGGTPNVAPLATPAPVSSARPLATATIAFIIPLAPLATASAARPAYISSKTVSFAAVLDAADAYTAAQVMAYNSQYGAPVVETLGSGGSCPATPAGYACTIALLLPPGSDTLTLTTYDGPAASAHVLSQMTQTFPVVSGTNNPFAQTLDADTAAFTVTPPAGVTLAGKGCPGRTISGAGDLSATCTATLAAANPATLAFAFTISDPATATIPATTGGFPTLSVTSSNPSAFTAALSGETVTVTPVAPACPAAGPTGTTTITITSTPANPATDGLSPTSLTFTLAVAPYAGQRMYVSNYDDGTILVYPVAPVGTVNTYPLAEICSNPSAGSGTASLSHPGGIAIDPAGKHLYVSNFDGGVNNAGFVSIFNLPTGFAASAPLGTIDDSNGVMSAPEGVTVDASDRVYVTNRGNTNQGAIDIFADPLASGASPAAAPLAAVTGLNEPFGVELDASDRIYLAQYSANALDIYSAYAVAGVAPQRLAENSTTFPPFADTVNNPTDVAIDSTGQIYVLNLSTDSVGVYSAFTAPGVAPSLAGTVGTGYDGLFLYPYGIALDRSNGLYVTDSSRGTISYFAPFAASAPPSSPTGVIVGAATGIAPRKTPYPTSAYGIAIY